MAGRTGAAGGVSGAESGLDGDGAAMIVLGCGRRSGLNGKRAGKARDRAAG
jgi:hypothetical protein